MAKTIKDLSETAEVFRQVSVTEDLNEEELFGSICSFCGLNNPGFSEEPGADLIVRLNMKSARLKNKACGELKTELQERFKDVYNDITIKELMLGKGCFQIEIPNHKNILSCFDNTKDGIFNGVSRFYGKYVASSHSYWSAELGNGSNPVDANIGIVEINERKNFVGYEKENGIFLEGGLCIQRK